MTTFDNPWMFGDRHRLDQQRAQRLLPSVFVSHGAPTLVLDNGPARRFLSAFGRAIGRPRAILVVSAHWEAPEVRILATPQPSTIHDFHGFPAALYERRYGAPGALATARAAFSLLEGAGYPAILDDTRGYDHGVWIPLSLMYPLADIPVTQVSINPERPPAYHWRLGRVLGALRSEGVLILGSGSLTHNLQDFRQQREEVNGPVAPYAAAFSEWFATNLKAGDLDALLAYRERAPEAQRAHPADEHLLPIFTALGAAGVSWSAARVHQGFMHGAIAMDSYVFQSAHAPEIAGAGSFKKPMPGESHAI